MIYICFLSLIVIKQIVANDLCVPYGVRVQLGKYYTSDRNMDDMINILYNTNVTQFVITQDSCPQTYATLNGRSYQVTQTQMINMSQIYQGYKPISSHFYAVDYTYVTYVQRIQIGQINAGETYEYIVYGNKDQNASSIGSFKFTVPLKNIKPKTRAVFFGDMDSLGMQNNSKPTFDWFQKQSQTNRTEYDVMIYTGDMAYDLESQNCQVGDYFLRNFTTIAAYWPVMLTPGNHDSGNNTQFPIFRKSFYGLELNKINTQENFYNLYSFDIGLVHFISFNPYKFLYMAASDRDMEIYYNELEKDLSDASSNYLKTPWIVVYSHYPMMCADTTTSQCTKNLDTLEQFNNLFILYGVQLYVAAHSHGYDRSMNEEYMQSKRDNLHTIHYGGSPVYLVEGAAGNDRDWTEIKYPFQKHTRAQYEKQSVGIMTVINQTHLYFEQYSTKDNRVVDYFHIIQGHEFMVFKENSRVWEFILLGFIGVVIIVGLAFVLKRFSKEKQSEKLNPQEFEMQQEEKFNP